MASHIRGDLVVTGNLTVSGSTINNGHIAENITLDTGHTFAITDADALSVGGKIVPQTFAVALRQAQYGKADWTAPFACKVVSVKERHSTAEATAATLTLMLKKVPSGTAASAGTNCLSAGINQKTTADTNQAGSLSATAVDYTLAAGDSLGAVLSTTGTELAGSVMTVQLQKV